MKNEKTIIKPVKEEIINPTVNLSIDYSEIGIDDILNNDAISEIPIVKTIVGFTKIGLSIKERFDIKKLLIFFKEFHSGDIEKNRLEEFKNKFKNNKKYRTKIVETILIMNERFLNEIKSKILANLINAHIEKKLTLNELNDILVVLDIIHPKSFNLIKVMSEVNWYVHNQGKDDESLTFSCGIGYRNGNKFSINKLGQNLYNYGIKPTIS